MALGVVVVGGALLPDLPLLLLLFFGRGFCSWSSLVEVKMPLLVRGLTLLSSGDTVAFMVMGEDGAGVGVGVGVGVGALDVSFAKGWVASAMSWWKMIFRRWLRRLFDSGVVEKTHAEAGFVSDFRVPNALLEVEIFEGSVEHQRQRCETFLFSLRMRRPFSNAPKGNL